MEPERVEGAGLAPLAGWSQPAASLASTLELSSLLDPPPPRVSTAPDGGWGWVVVFASFVISMVADGISFSFGLLYVQFLEVFQGSKSATAWIGSLFMAVPLLAGPPCSALVDRFGCRSMTIVGACISCAGFALSSLVKDITTMYFTFGLISGLGLGLCYVTAVVSIACWFDKRRSLASSLGACGSGIGTFAYSPLTQYLIVEYGWRGTVLLLGGTLLNMAVCGALMRDPPNKSDGEICPKESTSPDFHSVVNLPTFVRQSEKVPVEVLQALGNNRRVFHVVLENYPSLLHCDSEPKPRPYCLNNIRVHRSSLMYRSAMLNLHKYRLRASSCPDIYRNSMTTIAKESGLSWRQEMMDLFRDMSDFSLFLELHFLLVSLATGIVFVWFIVPYFYLAEHMSRHGYSEEDASMVLSVIGITNTIGMIGFGWAGDRPWLNIAWAYGFCLVITGLLTAAIPVVTPSWSLLLAVAGGFGAFFASCYSFTPPLLVELVPLDRFTTAYGLSLLCQGIGNLLGPPLAGWVFDMTQTWDWSFYLAGAWLIAAGFLVALVPITTNRRLWGSGPLEKPPPN